MTSDAELALRHINREWSERLKQMPLLTETIDNLDLIYQHAQDIYNVLLAHPSKALALIKDSVEYNQIAAWIHPAVTEDARFTETVAELTVQRQRTWTSWIVSPPLLFILTEGATQSFLTTSAVGARGQWMLTQGGFLLPSSHVPLLQGTDHVTVQVIRAK